MRSVRAPKKILQVNSSTILSRMVIFWVKTFKIDYVINSYVFGFGFSINFLCELMRRHLIWLLLKAYLLHEFSKNSWSFSCMILSSVFYNTTKHYTIINDSSLQHSCMSVQTLNKRSFTDFKRNFSFKYTSNRMDTCMHGNLSVHILKHEQEHTCVYRWFVR